MTNCNIPNRTIFCHDNLDVLRGINSECIDLIYLDPPFNKNKKFTAPIGSSAEGAEFSDIFREEDVKSEWLLTIKEDHTELFHYLNGIRGVGNPYNFAYLAYMSIRLLEMKRILKPTGSIYLHCDPTMSHYLKSLMDCIFEEGNFRNEIVWRKYGGRKNNAKNRFTTQYDVLLFYAVSQKAVFAPIFEPLSPEALSEYRHIDNAGRKYRMARRGKGYESEGGKKRIYLDQSPGSAIGTLWVEKGLQLAQGSKERTGYPTQKPLALLQRIIKASCPEDGIVLDPFCGCATTCVASEMLDRQWIGIDISYKAYELVKMRLNTGVADQHDTVSFGKQIHMKTSPPKRTDLDKDYREQKFVYVISHPSYPGEYKVGIASNWISRLNAYQTSDPDRAYKMEHKLETPDFRTLEKHIHNKFPNKHEWVQADLKDIIEEIKNYKAE